MKKYTVELKGITPLLMHSDNLSFNEKIVKWRKDPANKELSTPGDDRCPAWTWVGYTYHDGKEVGISSDNIMTMLREGGAKVLTGKRTETYKKQTQAGIMLDRDCYPITFNGGNILTVGKLNSLIGHNEFIDHVEFAEEEGFELLVKRAKINGKSKHVRVRPMFRDWSITIGLTVLDQELSGITPQILQTILDQAGALCGLCDWRPSSPSSGSFGKFEATIL